VLVDSGAEANFLSSTLVTALDIPLLPLPPFRVEVGNGAISMA